LPPGTVLVRPFITKQYSATGFLEVRWEVSTREATAPSGRPPR
jgi:hypothetical protein